MTTFPGLGIMMEMRVKSWDRVDAPPWGRPPAGNRLLGTRRRREAERHRHEDIVET